MEARNYFKTNSTSGDAEAGVDDEEKVLLLRQQQCIEQITVYDSY